MTKTTFRERMRRDIDDAARAFQERFTSRKISPTPKGKGTILVIMNINNRTVRSNAMLATAIARWFRND